MTGLMGGHPLGHFIDIPGPRLKPEVEAELDAELAKALGMFLSEYLDDEAPLNQPMYESAAKRAVAKFGLIARNPTGEPT
jgi:hypothetical protein